MTTSTGTMQNGEMGKEVTGIVPQTGRSELERSAPMVTFAVILTTVSKPD